MLDMSMAAYSMEDKSSVLPQQLFKAGLYKQGFNAVLPDGMVMTLCKVNGWGCGVKHVFFTRAAVLLGWPSL